MGRVSISFNKNLNILTQSVLSYPSSKLIGSTKKDQQICAKITVLMVIPSNL